MFRFVSAISAVKISTCRCNSINMYYIESPRFQRNQWIITRASCVVLELHATTTITVTAAHSSISFLLHSSFTIYHAPFSCIYVFFIPGRPYLQKQKLGPLRTQTATMLCSCLRTSSAALTRALADTRCTTTAGNSECSV